MAFIETRFPVDISFNSTGGPEFNSTVVPMDNGSEQILKRWPVGRHRYDAASGIKTSAQYSEVLSLVHVVGGIGDGFRWKDKADYKTTSVMTEIAAFDDCELVDVDGNAVTGDGTTTVFYLAKKYTFGATSVYRPITKPVNGTILIGVNGVLQTETTHYTINYTTGAVTFVTAPPNTHAVTCGGEFDVPVRLNANYMPMQFIDKADEDDFYIDFPIPILEIKP